MQQYQPVQTENIDIDEGEEDIISSTKCSSMIDDEEAVEEEALCGDDDNDEEYGELHKFSKHKRSSRCGSCCQCCGRCCYRTILTLIAIKIVTFVSLRIYIRWGTRQHFMRRGPGPFPKNIDELVLYRQGLRFDWPKIYQKNPIPRRHSNAPNPQMCFVHVGKSAGSTLSCYLGFLHGRCESHYDETTHERIPKIGKAPGLLLPDAVTHMIHVSYNDCTHQDFDYYLYVVRDPLSRIQSWFTYEHPMNIAKGPKFRYWSDVQKLYVDCAFDTLNQLGEIGLAEIGETENAELSICQRRARCAITGREYYYFHNYYNYGFYLDQVERYHSDSSTKTLVIRSEHLETDWNSIELDILHGDGEQGSFHSFSSFRHTNSSPKRPQDLVLSDVARERICRYLCDEIQVYKGLLQSALNLKPSDVETSMQELKMKCPIEALSTTCSIEDEFQRQNDNAD
jgi:hypothetical protein